MHYHHGGCACYQYVTEAEATPEMKARRLFGRQWHSLYSRIEPFAGGRCNHRGCSSPAVRRIMCNIWGSVAEYDVCETHGQEYHGKLLDDFPYEDAAMQSREIPEPSNQAR